MARTMIQIDADKCVGCGLCVSACKESAIDIVDGTAKLVRADYCDGLGNCLPRCPVGAISFSTREVVNQKPPGCPGSQSAAIPREGMGEASVSAQTHLNQWPVQIKLLSPNASYFHKADLLVAADCAAYAYGNFHQDYMKGRITTIGCPKLDAVDYAEKLTSIFTQNEIASITLARMEVPCCSGLEQAMQSALARCGKAIPVQVATLSTDGRLL